jgi:hypothetical protein
VLLATSRLLRTCIINREWSDAVPETEQVRIMADETCSEEEREGRRQRLELWPDWEKKIGKEVGGEEEENRA